MVLQTFRPGELCQVSALYEIFDEAGWGTGQARLILKGEKFPALPQRRLLYSLIDSIEK